MQATLLLADAANRDADGKVNALGMGWSITSAPTPPMALIMLFKVPWDETNRKHHLRLSLVDSDGQPVEVPAPMGTGPIEVRGEFEAGRPPGVPKGTAIDMSQVVPVGPGIPLRPGHTYQWRLEIDDQPREEWVASFYIRP
ncbi:MAG: DUF6941 family protein [Streptomycetales bacterium]